MKPKTKERQSALYLVKADKTTFSLLVCVLCLEFFYPLSSNLNHQIKHVKITPCPAVTWGDFNNFFLSFICFVWIWWQIYLAPFFPGYLVWAHFKVLVCDEQPGNLDPLDLKIYVLCGILQTIFPYSLCSNQKSVFWTCHPNSFSKYQT